MHLVYSFFQLREYKLAHLVSFLCRRRHLILLQYTDHYLVSKELREEDELFLMDEAQHDSASRYRCHSGCTALTPA